MYGGACFHASYPEHQLTYPSNMDSLEEFALAAIAELSRHLHELLEDGQGNGKAFYITLTILLEDLQHWLESERHETNFDRHVWKLLRRLDQLVQVRKQCCRTTLMRLNRNMFHSMRD